jgi:hypothetical protein
MTIAELLVLVAGAAAIYALLRPLQRWLERSLARRFSARRPRLRRPILDADFTSDRTPKKDEHHA